MPPPCPEEQLLTRLYPNTSTSLPAACTAPSSVVCNHCHHQYKNHLSECCTGFPSRQFHPHLASLLAHVPTEKKKKKKIPTFYAAQMLKFSLAFHVCRIKPCLFCVWVLLLFSCTNQNHINIFETKHSPRKWSLFQDTFPPGTGQHILPNPGTS